MSVAAAVCTACPPTGVRSRARSSEHSSRTAANSPYPALYRLPPYKRPQPRKFEGEERQILDGVPGWISPRCPLPLLLFCWRWSSLSLRCRILEAPRSSKSTHKRNMRELGITLKVEPLYGCDKIRVRVFVKIHDFGKLKCREWWNTELQSIPVTAFDKMTNLCRNKGHAADV